MKWEDDESWTDLWLGIVMGLGVLGLIVYVLVKLWGG